MRGALPSSTSIGMSTGWCALSLSARRRSASTGVRRSPCRPPRTGSARARRSLRTPADRPARWPARNALALRSTRFRAATSRSLRAGILRRSKIAPLPAPSTSFRERVRQTARADVVNAQDRVLLAKLPAGVDHFLRAPLDFRVAALHRIEVEFGGIGAGRHRAGRAAAHADAHARAADLDQQRCLPADRACAYADRRYCRCRRRS